jgi:hypothetical protein
MTDVSVDGVLSGLSRDIVVCLLIVRPTFVSSGYVMSADVACGRPWNVIFRAGVRLDGEEKEWQ